MERVVASLVLELDPQARIVTSPKGFKGLILVEEAHRDPEELASLIEKNVPEAEKVIVAKACVEADVTDLVAGGATMASEIKLPEGVTLLTSEARVIARVLGKAKG